MPWMARGGENEDDAVKRGHLHHLELWRDDATATEGPWPWLLQRLGYSLTDSWVTGCTWSRGEAYVVLESGADHVRGRANRLRSGMNHLALWAGGRADVDALTSEAPQHGWRVLFADLHPRRWAAALRRLPRRRRRLRGGARGRGVRGSGLTTSRSWHRSRARALMPLVAQAQSCRLPRSCAGRGRPTT